MLPGLRSDALSLADVFPSCLAALRSEPNALGLPGVRAAVVLLVDGLGAHALRDRAGHARTLAASGASMDSGFPTTTASALATLTTGTRAGQHGLVGYTVLDAQSDRLINQLSGWEGLDPGLWQGMPTVFEQAVDAGLRASAIMPTRYHNSPFTHAVLRGAAYVAGVTIADRLAAAAALLATPGAPQLVYVYVYELDKAGHAYGWESEQWTAALEDLDAAVRDFALPKDVGLIVTADHGMVDIAAHQQVLFDTVPELMDGVAHVGGEPRCLQLYLDSGADQSATVAAWHASEDSRSWVVTRAEAIAAGWFGDVRPEVEGRIGDLIVAARTSIAYYASNATPRSRAMIGQHGSWSADEVRVPLLRFGAFD
jgi:hypothetical protein